jgi:hypothetical protein
MGWLRGGSHGLSVRVFARQVKHLFGEQMFATIQQLRTPVRYGGSTSSKPP